MQYLRPTKALLWMFHTVCALFTMKWKIWMRLGAKSFMKKLFYHTVMTLHSCISSCQMKPFLNDFALQSLLTC
jgi:hypothetical protein